MNVDYIKQRVQELFLYINYLKDSANTDTKEASDTIQKIKETTNEDDSLNLMKKFKKLQFFNNLKLGEMEKTMPILIELISIANVIDLDLELNEEESTVFKMNKNRIKPMYVVDKNTLVFNFPELEVAVDKEINEPSPSDLEALKKITKALTDGK